MAVFGVTPYVALYAAGVFGEVAPDQCLVGTVRVVIEELCAQLRLSFRCLGYNEQSAGVFVDAVHQSDAGVVGVVRWKIAQVPSYGVYQCAVEVAYAWVYHQSCRFVDDHQLVVLIDNVEGDVFRFYGGVVVRTVQHQGDNVAGTNLIVTLDRVAVDLYKSGIGSFLYAVARRVLYMFCHVLVNTYRLLPSVYLHAQVFI